jgi:hypothetical protein
VKPATRNPPVDLVGAEARIEELAPSDDAVLAIRQLPDLNRISSAFPADNPKRAQDRIFAPRRVGVGAVRP